EVAQKTMQELSSLRAEVERWRSAARHIDETLELAQLDDDSLEHELDAEVETLSALVERLSLEAMLSGPYDRENTILAIHAGAGGTDSQDWGQMLERMFLRWAEQNGYKVEVQYINDGEEAGIKGASILVRGENAYGWLKTESGVHRLVRISPYDSQARRHTSFSSVWIYPEIDDNVDIEIQDKDIRIDTFRSSGAGGQHVNTTDSAVRITHMPTGIVVTSSEKSQHQNRANAMKALRARLYDLEMKKRQESIQEQHEAKSEIGWGHQIRSYVLQPYQLVKDLRTGVENTSPDSVLGGDLNEFMEASLIHQVTGGEGEVADIE
ncbi:MAG: peptide chain release factor 2, partial [Nitratireductor sp.]|nr:peptide chain release factor 2 [Nitratireductor sp.]